MQEHIIALMHLNYSINAQFEYFKLVTMISTQIFLMKHFFVKLLIITTYFTFQGSELFIMKLIVESVHKLMNQTKSSKCKVLFLSKKIREYLPETISVYHGTKHKGMTCMCFVIMMGVYER